MRSAPRFEAVPLKLVDNPVAVDYVRRVLGLVLMGLLVAAIGARVGMSQAILPLVAGSPWIGLFAMLGLVFWAMLIGFFGYVAVVVLPTVNEYYTIQRAVDKVAASGGYLIA